MKNKFLTFLGAFLVAMFLWFYVVTAVSPDSQQSFYNIPVVFENESALQDRNLMLVSSQNPTVSIRLNGNRSDLNKLTNGSIMVTVDLRSITEPGHYEREFRVTLPSGYPSVSLYQRITATVPVDVVEYGSKQVPVKLLFAGEMQEGLILDQDEASLATSTVTVSGPKSEVDQIASAGITIECANLTETLVGDYIYTLLDETDTPVDAKNVITDTGAIHVVLPVEHVKEIPLKVELIPGGGATEENAECVLSPATVLVSGSQEALDRITELTVATVDLSQLDAKEVFEEDVELKLPETVTNRSNLSTVHVRVSLLGLGTKTFTIGKDQIRVLNVPDGLTANIFTQQLDVTIRGPLSIVSALTADKISVTLDAANQPMGRWSSAPTITVEGGKAGSYGKYSVTVELVAFTEDEEG